LHLCEQSRSLRLDELLDRVEPEPLDAQRRRRRLTNRPAQLGQQPLDANDVVVVDVRQAHGLHDPLTEGVHRQRDEVGPQRVLVRPVGAAVDQHDALGAPPNQEAVSVPGV
jgi:hypothetical protein